MTTNKKTAVVFGAFSASIKALTKKGIDFVNNYQPEEMRDTGFKCTLKAIEDALNCVEEEKSCFKFDLKKHTRVHHFRDYPGRTEILAQIESEIKNYAEDIESAGNLREINCLNTIQIFIASFMAARPINHERYLHTLMEVPDQTKAIKTPSRVTA